MATLGRLMNESQASCRDDYDCSSAGLDAITEIARRHGAAGSRLTGAGWGGCAVSLLPSAAVSGFLAALKTEYYDARGFASQADAALFTSVPSSGAAVYTPPTSFEI